MIKKLYFAGVDLTNDNYWPTRLEGVAMPSIAHKSYNLGSRDGVALGTPYYVNLKLRLDIIVKGSSPADYITKRDYLLGLLRFGWDRSTSQTKQLKIVDANDGVRIANVMVADVKGDLTPDRKSWGYFTILLETDREYLQGLDQELTIHLDKGKGWGLPFGIPFAIDQDTGSEVREVINEGNTESYPTIRVYGDLNGFTLHNATLNLSLTSSEVLGTSDYIDLDFYNRTAVKNGITNVLNTISGTWWPLQTGSNELKLISSSTSNVAKAVITYHNAYLGL